MGGLAAAGCGGGSEEAEQGEAAGFEHSSGVPGRLTAAESGAEDIIALALSGDRRGVVTGSSRLSEASSGATATALTRGGVPARDVSELRRRTARLARLARNGSFVEIELAANAVSQLMPALYGKFESPVRAGILELDYLDREAEFRSEAGQPTAVAAAVRTLGRTWADMRPKVVAAGGMEESRAYQAHVMRMERLSPAAAAIEDESNRGLELVDRLEGVFTQ